MKKYDWLRQYPIAHRGYHTSDAACPENSLASFQRAIECNFAIELDVQISLDGKIVVFHDESLQRMCGRNAMLSTLKSEEITKLTLLNSSQTIPLLTDVLSLVNGQVPLLIELKSSGKVGLLEGAVHQILCNYNGLVAIQSFNPLSIRWFYKNAPAIPRGQLSGNLTEEDLNPILKFSLKHLFFNYFTKPDFIAYDKTGFPNKKLARLRLEGYIILAWTIYNREEMVRLKPYTDNMIFERFNPIQNV